MGDWGVGVFQDDHALDAAADISDAEEPNAHIEAVLKRFLEATSDGYDRSEYAQDWARAREILSICEVVRLGQTAGSLIPGSIPSTVEKWLLASGFHSSRENGKLAVESCRRLLDSQWLRLDWPEFVDGTIGPLHRRLETGLSSVALSALRTG